MLKAVLLSVVAWIKKLNRILLVSFLVLAGGCISVIFALRYWVLPDIEHYHADITAAASKAIGRPLHIGHIAADWNGFRPRVSLTDVRILDDRGRTALELPVLRNTIAWGTLISGSLRIQTLELDEPELLIRRDAQGRLYVGGILSGEQAGVESAAEDTDWLLHQSHIVVHGGRIVWQDEMRAAAAITFKRFELLIDNRGDHHRFALRASPSGKLASSIDLRGNLYGSSFSGLSDWRGELFARLDEMDVAAWNERFTLPAALKSGRGGLQLWLGISHGQINQVDTDIALRNVSTQLASDLPLLEMNRISGRFGWRQTEGVVEVSTRQLSWLMRDGYELKPTDLFVSISGSKGYQSASGEIRANTINLADANKVMAYLPVAEALKKRMADLAPQGRVSELQATWQGDVEHLGRFRLQARFKDIGLRATEGLPGISGLSGSVEGSDHDGTLRLESRNLSVQAANFLAEPLAFDRVSARLDWQRNELGWNLKLNNAQVSNADLDGVVFGSYQTNDGPGEADISINLTRASVKHAARYIPLHALDDLTYHWLQTGLQEGMSDNFKMRVRGDLKDFPFADSKKGLFKIEAKAKNVAIEFDPGWPRIERATTNLLIQGGRLEVSATTAMTAGAALQNTTVVLPNTLAKELVLHIKGEAAGAAQRSLDYIRNSPVRGYLDGVTDNFKVEGDGLLKLQLDIPLSGNALPRIRGSYLFSNNEVDLGAQIPQLSNVSGTFAFTGDSVQASDIKAQILGGPARISASSDKGVLSTHASGRLNADNFPSNYTYPLLRRLHGSADWTVEMNVKNKLADVQVASDLVGLVSDLPQPFTKAAGEAVKMRFEIKDVSAKQDLMRLRYGELISADLHRTQTTPGGDWEIRQGDIVLGNPVGKGGKEGIWITGNLSQFALEGWNGWSDFPPGDGMLPNIAGINVTLGKVHGYGNVVHQLNIRGSGRNGLISTRLASRELNGDVIWQPQNEGKLLVRLKNAMLGEGAGTTREKMSATITGSEMATAPLSLPLIDVAVENLSWKGRALGKMDMMMQGEEGDIVMKSLHLTNADGVLYASGRWSSDPQQTQIKAKVDIVNSGKLLGRYGYEESIRDGSGTLQSDLVWNGSPGDFNYGSLNGTLHLKTGKGRFMQVNPGAAKLLGVLSLQSLPKRISLDFTDVLSPGFEFDSIVGEAAIEHGLLKAGDFRMDGAAAKISLNGQVDLEHETQKLHVRVMPTIGDNVSLLSFAAGPAIGVSVLLANKILSDPLDKLVSFDYNVTGSWADPKVERASRIKGFSAPDESAGFTAN